jgi:pimeloyl-ACP methyl ester carboxylesterase
MLGFREQGHGPALVFLHAFPLDSTMWREQSEFFSGRYRVIMPDVLGFGQSQPPRPWTMADMGAELLQLMDALAVQRFTLVGLSMGGYIGLPFALAHPERVERLVLAHTRARSDTDAERAARNDMIEGLKKDGIAPLPDKMLGRLLGPETRPEVRAWVRSVIERTGAAAAIHAVTAMRDREDHTSNLAKLRCPVLVVAGDSDAIMKVEDCEKMAAAIPGGQLQVIPKTGHLSNLEDPAAFNRALDRFV